MDDILEYIRERFVTIEKLSPSWATLDDDEDKDNEQHIPPSSTLCHRVRQLLEKDLSFFQTKEDLPHICPNEESPGIELYWQNKGISLTFYDESTSSPERYHFVCVGCSRSTNILMGDVDDTLPTYFTGFLRSHINH